MDIVEIDLFNRTFELKRASHLSTEGNQVWYRWMYTEKGFQIALCRSVITGNYNAYVNFDEEEPTIRRFNVWGIESDDPNDSVRSLQESVLSVGMLLSNVLRGQEIES